MASKEVVITILLFACVVGTHGYGDIFNALVENSNNTFDGNHSGIQMSSSYQYYYYRQGLLPFQIACIIIGVISTVFFIIGCISCCICGGPKVTPGRVISTQQQNMNIPQHQMYPGPVVNYTNYGVPQQAPGYTSAPYNPNTVPNTGPQVQGGSNVPQYPPAYDNATKFPQQFE